MKRLEVFLFPPGWDASTIQVERFIGRGGGGGGVGDGKKGRGHFFFSISLGIRRRDPNCGILTAGS